MKKVMRSLIVVLLLFSMLVFTGCNSEIKPTDENSYLISVYSVKREQKTNGEVVNTGLELKKTIQVLKTQCFELDYEEVKLVDYDGDTYEALGKYEYSSLPSQRSYFDKKIVVFPTSDATILVRERQKKNIKIYYGGEEVLNNLGEREKVEYNNYFKNTYNESFSITGTNVDAILKGVKKNVTIELYTHSSCVGEPFAEGSFTYRSYGFSGSIDFELIQSTDIYVKVIQ
ncbi:MAG: hypothetical protein J6Q52_05570 [Clostridia bacterium]|nr:hypothetical protein [Clostridia bacterium]